MGAKAPNSTHANEATVWYICTHKKLIIFSFFSQSLPPNPNVKPPHIPVSSKKKHCDAAISAKDTADNPKVKEASKGKSPKTTPNQKHFSNIKKVSKRKSSEANGSNPPISKKRKNSQNINPPEKATEIENKKEPSIAPTPENQALEPKKDSVAPENKSSPPAIDIETYEEKRLRNIAERKKKFNELQLTEKRLAASGKKPGVAPTPESEPAPAPESEPAPKTNRKIVRNPFYKPNSTSVNTSSKKEKNTNSTGQLISE